MKVKKHDPDESSTAPLILTLQMDGQAQVYFDQLRDRWFPKERNFIKSHITLFHALPDGPEIINDLEEIVSRYQAFELFAQSVISLGKGTAIKVAAPTLTNLHLELQKRWFKLLSAQDQHKPNFHITVQNKVEPSAAKALQLHLAQSFAPFYFRIEGVQLWHYLNGPWEKYGQFSFSKS